MNTKITHPLFHPKTLNNAIRNFAFPQDLDQRHALVKKWLEPLKAGTLNEIKEVSLHGEFLKDIFQQVLGYASVISGGGKAWEIHAETTISDGGGSADAALGFFTASAGKKDKIKLEGKVIAPIELKGAKEDLDRPLSGRKESAVEQGWRYANYTPDCRWVIVSNYRELRLYYTSKTPAYYERFRLVDLEDIQEFKRFYFILCRLNFLGVKPDKPSAIDRLLAESNEVQENITKQLYQEYKEIRGQLVKHFRFSGPKDLPDRDRLLIEKAQKTLDRILFIAFCEDKGLLPAKTIIQAHDHQDPYNPRPIWENYQAVFRWVDKGNENPPISGYNGGLFELDPLLDEQLTVPNLLCGQIKQLSRYDFDTEVSVDILGRIFEQSVTDLEELKAEATGQEYNQKKGKRKTQGVFYTPAFITQYIVEVALGGYLKKQEQEIRDRLQLEQISPRATKKRQQAEIQFWETYRDEVLKQTRVIDPACGSGAFLIAAFEYLLREYERVNQALASLEIGGKGDAEIVGQRSLFELNRTILNQNLYGVDLSPESVEITKLSLWLKTAEKGKPLTDLDGNIKVGNSIVDDPEVAERAFNWQAEFPEVFADGGFDVAIGNPPYVRQELLSPIKPYLQKKYQSYDGVADLYAYFYEQGLNILKPGGVLSYIVTNKWLRAGYGEPLRRFFVENSVFEEIVDFGHAPIFEDADTFPCIVALRKRFDPPQPPFPRGEQEGISPGFLKREDDVSLDPPQPPLRRGEQEGISPGFLKREDDVSLDPPQPPLRRGEQEGISPGFLKREDDVSLDPPQPPLRRGEQEGISPGSGEKYVQVCPVPREKLADINLTQYVQQESYPVAWSRFSGDAWSLELPEVEALMEKIQRGGIPLKEFAGVKPYRGILTGFNEAFLIDEATKNRLVKADPKSAEVIKPFLRGRDIKRWSPDWQNLWMIFTKRGIDIDAYPAVKVYLSQYREKLEPRPKDWNKNQDGEWLGRKTGSYQWYEIQDAVDYWEMFEQPKIIYQEINTFPAYAIDTQGYFANNKVFLIAKPELYLCGCLNSPLGWWIAHQIFPKMIGDAVTPRGDIMVNFPIAPPTDQIREQVEPIVSRLIEITKANQTAYKEVLDWLQVEQQIDKAGEKLEDFANLEEKDFIQEVKKRKPKSSGSLSPAALKELRQVYQDYAPNIQGRQAEALTLEHRLSDLVNQVYGLTPEEIDLMWKTAPPRMPIAPEK